MTHYELMDFGKKLGLEVETLRCLDMAKRQEVVETVFRMPRTYDPRTRQWPRGDLITKFSFHDMMEQGEYYDALAGAYNSLKQFELWR